MMVILAISFVGSIIYDNYVGENQCEALCSDYNAEFSSYDSGGFGSDECWCKKEGEPLRVK